GEPSLCARERATKGRPTSREVEQQNLAAEAREFRLQDGETVAAARERISARRNASIRDAYFDKMRVGVDGGCHWRSGAVTSRVRHTDVDDHQREFRLDSGEPRPFTGYLDRLDAATRGGRGFVLTRKAGKDLGGGAV